MHAVYNPSHMKCLVTGGAGFIGSHLVDALIARGHRVLIIDDLSSGTRANINTKAEFKKMDIRNQRIAKLVADWKPDAVFHLAAQISVSRSVNEPVLDAETNVLATVRLLHAASESGVKRFIFAGTGGALSSEQTVLPTPEDKVAQPQSPYAIAKVASEHYGAFYRKTRGLNFASFRFGNVYGPRQNPHGEAGVIAIFAQRMLKGEPVRINGTGKQTRDYVYVDDVVRALLSGLKKPNAAGPYHVGTGIETDVNHLFKSVAKLIGYKLKPLKGPADKGAPLRSALDGRKIKRELGWKPEVELDEGLGLTVEWFRSRTV